jgi:hypothetical protein
MRYWPPAFRAVGTLPQRRADSRCSPGGHWSPGSRIGQRHRPSGPAGTGNMLGGGHSRTGEVPLPCAASCGPGGCQGTRSRSCARPCCALPKRAGGARRAVGNASMPPDATPVLAAIHPLSRLDGVAAPVRQALHGRAAPIPDAVLQHVSPDGDERAATRWQAYRLPSGPQERQERQDRAELLGQDGRELFALRQPIPRRPWTRKRPAVETRRRVWVQHVYADGAIARWPPARLLSGPPSDPEARVSQPRATTGTGATGHLSARGAAQTPPGSTAGHTTPAPLGAWARPPPLPAARAARHRLPTEQRLDRGAVTATRVGTADGTSDWHASPAWGPQRGVRVVSGCRGSIDLVMRSSPGAVLPAMVPPARCASGGPLPPSVEAPQDPCRPHRAPL